MNFLQQDIQYLQGIGPQRKKLFNSELKIFTYEDLINNFPYKHIDRTHIFNIRELTTEMPYVQVRGRILSFQTFTIGPHRQRLVAHLSDGHGVIDLVWFQGIKYIQRQYHTGTDYIVFGKPTVFQGRINISHPEIERAEDVNIDNLNMHPTYHTTEKMKNAGVTSRQIGKTIQTLLANIKKFPETLPDFIRTRLHLIDRDTALRNIHFPQTTSDLAQAQLRLKFEELFFIQLNIICYASQQRNKYRGYTFRHVGAIFHEFYNKHLPFTLTSAQKRVIRDIKNDCASGRQMNRLLQGDVGSGKTLVALMTMLLSLDNGYQACIMAPTEILAEQHLTTIHSLLGDMPVRIEILTSTVKGKKREAVIKGLADGSVDILVGTHAIIEDYVIFRNLGFVVIDEQHRFGVAQRAKLWNKNNHPPHVLVMTATPIPRTLAMTLYGDLDVSIIDELPPGRKPVSTIHKDQQQERSLYNGIRQQINEGRQVYVVYPLIKESEKSDLQDLENGYLRLREAFPEFHISKVHGKMKPAEKDAEMQDFISGKTHILVATTVIEVGVNVPNASVMVIQNAERFGLSQLHQLRGRVGRGADQSYCILVTKDMGKNSITHQSDIMKRINIMCSTNDGFEIAEADLKLRGPGDLEGTQQSGMAFDLKIADIARDGQIVQMARDEAQQIIDNDPTCSRPEYSMLWQRLRELRKDNINWGVIS